VPGVAPGESLHIPVKLVLTWALPFHYLLWYCQGCHFDPLHFIIRSHLLILCLIDITSLRCKDSAVRQERYLELDKFIIHLL
jgi:hypothetical protein